MHCVHSSALRIDQVKWRGWGEQHNTEEKAASFVNKAPIVKYHREVAKTNPPTSAIVGANKIRDICAHKDAGGVKFYLVSVRVQAGFTVQRLQHKHGGVLAAAT